MASPALRSEPTPSTDADTMIRLLQRCRSALSPGDMAWEKDVGTAMASDAVLVGDIDDVLRKV